MCRRERRWVKDCQGYLEKMVGMEFMVSTALMDHPEETARMKFLVSTVLIDYPEETPTMGRVKDCQDYLEKMVGMEFMVSTALMDYPEDRAGTNLPVPTNRKVYTEETPTMCRVKDCQDYLEKMAGMNAMMSTALMDYPKDASYTHLTLPPKREV